MSFVPMTAGGSSYSETLLWENSTPTADFANTIAYLNYPIAQFDYIYIEVKYAKNVDNRLTYIYKANEITNCVSGTQYPTMYLGNFYNSTYYYRPIWYSGADQLSIGQSRHNTLTGAASVGNNVLIPVTIKGIKR